ncbi:methyltransferase [Alicyclobacillus acidiphilus]|uniref:methyltransferase n=1 Tax=Alicyclobacillus acidiphilus TaxID=182455 RepID=UPI00082C3B45|nr:methyltransferase [Alicyclobacillus acidiphilus]
MKEPDYDKLLHIKTGGEHESPIGFHYYPYEPTPYSALEQLAKQYELKRGNRLVDFGCGKGRLNFFMHYLFQASVVGVEMNETLYHMSQQNLNNYMRARRTHADQIQFYHCLAEDYPVHPSDDRFYFFNPFSVQIYMKVIRNILRSFEQAPRPLDVLLYYPSDDYIYFMEHETPFVLEMEVPLENLFERNPYERFLIYRLEHTIVVARD